MSIIKIEEKFSDATLNIALDTLKIKKQALIFVNSKRSAESVAEKIAVKVKDVSLFELSEKIKKVLSKPTRQCERLAKCIKRGIAFHHAGLPSGQREIVEDNFRTGTIKIISSTPTLAIGIDMPAFRTVIRDLKRYGGRWGMQWIQVLEYHQMAGRAGRPGHEDWGEAITIAQTVDEKENIIDNFINAEPENIYSKLAVEPVLRTYVLSLIATGFVSTRSSLIDFFSNTFWAKQYQDMEKLEMILDKVIGLLIEWEFLNTSKEEFSSANEDEKFKATKLGSRVAQLYIDPLTANFIITCLRRATGKVMAREFSYTHMICSTLEMRPIFRVGVKEYQAIESKMVEVEDEILYVPPSMYEPEYEDYLASIKTATVLEEWMNELDESDLLEKYNVRPGELKAKLDRSEWLLNSTSEFASILGFLDLVKHIKKTQIRLKYGVKEELLTLLKLKNIGRIRARLLYRNGIKDLGDVKKVDPTSLAQLIGVAVAKDVKKQVGQDIKDIKIKPKKRKGQKNLGDY